MFFWMMLASLMGVMMFGNLYEKTKDQETFVAPVYEAMALSAYQQHVFAEQGFLDAMRLQPEATKAYLDSYSDGIVPLVTVENDAISGVDNDNLIYTFIQRRMPQIYKPQNNTRTYMFCMPKDGSLPGSFHCNDTGIVKYIMTIRQIPQRYDGSDKMTALEAISKATAHSRFVGMLEKAPEPLGGSGTTKHQPLGAGYYILSSGFAPVNSVYIPNYALCNFPLKNSSDDTVLGGTLTDSNSAVILENRSFIAALSLVSGLAPGENMMPSSVTCEALSSSGGGGGGGDEGEGAPGEGDDD